MTSFGTDGTRRAATGGTTLIPPLFRIWSRKLGDAIDTPLLVGGRVFVGSSRTHAASHAYGGDIIALRRRDGRVLWRHRLRFTYFVLHLTYTAGRVVALDPDGVLHAFAAKTGKPLWRRRVNSRDGMTPVGRDGVVYVSGEGRVTAVDARTGAIRWSSAPDYLPDADIAISGDRIFLAGSCAAAALDRRDGALLWRRNGTTTSCNADPVPRLWNDAVLGGGAAFAALDGATRGDRPTVGAVAGDVGIVLDGQFAAGFDLRTGSRRWRTRLYPGFSYPPILPSVAGRVAYVAYLGTFGDEANRMIAVDTGTGQIRGRNVLPHFKPAAESVGGALPGVAAGDGVVAVTEAPVLSVFAPLLVAPPRGSLLDGIARAAQWRERTVLYVHQGREIAAVRRFRVDADRFPYGKRWRTIKRGTTRTDGSAEIAIRPDRNTRYRLVLAGAPGARLRFDVFPKTILRFSRRSGRIIARAAVRGPGDVRLGGRRAYLYLGRVKAERWDRLGARRVLRRTGRGRAKVSFAFRPPHKPGKKDLIAVCFVGQAKAGLGDDRLARRCGARRVPF